MSDIRERLRLIADATPGGATRRTLMEALDEIDFLRIELFQARRAHEKANERLRSEIANRRHLARVLSNRKRDGGRP